MSKKIHVSLYHRKKSQIARAEKWGLSLKQFTVTEGLVL